MSEQRQVTITVDGREIEAIEGEMLHDAARKGDVEIPVFCYEPKLGDPVGACRMCLVEIEGIPKLQTSCSTPVREGMVVHTRTEQVKEAQSAVVEFLLVNHPLDCPVCDKGGECPLQDITQGWGPGRSRVIDEKRHFRKPVELSPLVAIDRERCILCYRCVRFSQEVAEDAQLQLLERGDRTFVGTFDDRPYVAPFHGNITDICPVGALTNYTYRFRARPWDIEQAGSICTLCPSQCNVSFTIRDEKVKRVIARDNHAVDDGWLCDRGRYGFEMFEAEQRVGEPRLKGGAPTSWEAAIAKAAAGLKAAGPRVAAIVGDASNEEALLVQKLVREALGAPHIDSRPSRGAGRAELVRLAQPELSAKVSEIDEAGAILVLGTDPLHSSPILDLRVRKAIRRNGAKLVVATERPTALDGGAEAIARYAPGETRHFIGELTRALGGAETVATPLVETLKDADTVVVLWGERILREDGVGDSLLALAEALGVAATEGAGLLEIPDFANARGLREAGCLPDAGPGLAEVSVAGHPTEEIRSALEAGDLDGLVLFGVDPLRDFPDSKAWEEAINSASFVVSFSMFENASSTKADLLFPLETHAEKDGTVTHPDGRLQRVRPSASRPGNVRSNIQVLSELCSALGLDTGINSQPTAFTALKTAIPFYSSIEEADLGGQGVRWQETSSASAVPSLGGDVGTPSERIAEEERRSPAAPATNGSFDEVPSEEGVPAASPSLALGTYRDLWAGPITELNPPLKFLQPQQRLEISLADAERLGLQSGDQVKVSQNGSGVEAHVLIKERVPEGVCFLAEGVAEGNANGLLNGGPVRVEISKLERVEA
ncbi:MAG TPA: NADH-quinone oxidoreductase subunit NuoG [Solirubrobacterales bacterium]|nr:NADH-quinone oxidoreductase subunit NuoG [Solirubrobacterales bacterium]